MADFPKTTRREFFKATLVAGAMLAVGPILPGLAATPATWTVLCGAEVMPAQSGQGQPMGPMGPSWQIYQYYPNTITINEGDTVVFKANSMESPAVTLLPQGQQLPEHAYSADPKNPERYLLNSLLFAPPVGGPNYDGSALVHVSFDESHKEGKVTFTKAGTYDYGWVFSSKARGRVIVQAAGTALAKTQAQYDTEAAAQINADKQAATAMEQQLAQVTSRAGQNGATIYTVKVGAGDGRMSFMRFTPENVTIKQGDTVEWVMNDAYQLHSVTFFPGGKPPEGPPPADFPNPLKEEQQQSGPPDQVIDPEALKAYGGAVFKANGVLNKWFFGNQNNPYGNTPYTLTFNTAGTHPYLCLPHAEMGMIATVTVQAAPQPTGMPNTGEGGGDEEQDRRALDD